MFTSALFYAKMEMTDQYWKGCDPMKKILVVVDYQNDFVNGSLGFPGAELLDEAICKKISEYNDSEVVYTLDTHGEGYMDTLEGRNLPEPHCIKGTDGHKNYGQTSEKLAGARCFEKSSFGSLELGEYLKAGGYDRVELCGLVSNICVLSNAVIARAALPNAEIVVDHQCTASSDPALNDAALAVLKGIQVTVL